ncbi:MAG: hypothetical protein ACKVQJ_03635 [Pyrinomonadaceae bacterium]
MDIVNKIEILRQKVKGGQIDAEDLAAWAIDAMRSGMQRPVGVETPQWRLLMSKISTDADELDRLCGKEDRFNQSRWGLASVAYIAGNALCTSETVTATGTIRAMSIEMIKNLDAEGAQLDAFEDKATAEAFAIAQNAANREDR